MANPFGAGNRPWTRITEALRVASSTIRKPGELVVTDGGKVFVPDGIKADKDLIALPDAASLAATYQPLIAQLEAVPLWREGDSYDDGSQGADQASRPFARLALRHNMGTVTKASVAGTRMDQVLARVIANAWVNKRGLIGLADCLLNDVFQFGTASNGQPTSREAFRALLAHLSARAISAVGGSALRVGPGWTAGASAGTSGRYADVAFSTATAYLLLNFVTGSGATVTVKNAAGTTVATVTTGGYAQAFTGAVKLTGTAGSTTTYRATVTGGAATIVGVAAQSATPAPIVWDKAGAITSTTSSSLLTAYQAACTAVLADFPNVLPVDMGVGWNAAMMISSEDGIHRNDLGTQYALTQIETVLRGTFVTTGLYQGLSRLSASGAAATYTDPTAVYNGAGATAPAAPTGLTVTPSDTSAVLSWAIPADNGATITAWTVQYRVTGASSWTTFSSSIAGANTSATVTGLTASTQHDFQVAATNTAGTGSYSSTVTATTSTPVTTYSADTFTRSDSTSLGSTETGAYAWSGAVSGGTFAWSIASNVLALTGTGSNQFASCIIADGQANGATAAKITASATGVIVRATGNTTGYVGWWNGTGYTISKRTATAGYSALASSSGVTAASGDVVKLVASGTTTTTLTLYVNGTQVATATDSSSPYTSGSVGVWGYAAGTFDNFAHTSA